MFFFLMPDVHWGRNVIIFDVDNSSSEHNDNRKGSTDYWGRTNVRII